MALNWYMAQVASAWTTPGGGLVGPESLQTVERFLREKAALPSELAPVA